MVNNLTIEWNRAQLWESAFKIAEAPMSYLNKLQNTYSERCGCFIEFFETMPTAYAIHRDQLLGGLSPLNLYEIKRGLQGWGSDVKQTVIHLYEKKHLVLITLGTCVALPLSLMMVPVSMIADIFSGVIQASLRLCQKADKEEVLSILHKKVIASPVQQSIYLLSSLILLGLIGGGAAVQISQAGNSFIKAFVISSLFCSALLGNLVYCRSQEAVANLPRFFRPDGYNVFLDNGATDSFGVKVDFDPESRYQKWRYQQQEEAKSHYRSYNTLSDPFAETKQRIKTELDKLEKKFPEKFIEIRTWFESGQKSYQLFGFLSIEAVSEGDLQKKYKSLALKCHPDKFQNHEAKEAEIWFKLLMEARLDVEEKIRLRRNAQ